MGRKSEDRAGQRKSSEKGKKDKDGLKSGSKTSRAGSKKERDSKVTKSGDVSGSSPPNSNTSPPLTTTCKKFGPCNLEAKQAHTAILLLKSSEEHIVLESLNCLQKFSKKREENKGVVVEYGGAQALARLVLHPHQVIQRLSLKLLAGISRFHKVKLVCRDFEVVPKLVGLLQSKDEAVVEYCTMILSNSATLYSGRADIIKHGGASLLLGLISRPDPDIERNSLEIIWRLLVETDNLLLFSDPKALPPIVHLIDSEYPAIQGIALSILDKVAALVPEFLDPFGIMANMGAKLGNMETADLHRICLRIVTSLAVAAPTSPKLIEILPTLSSLIDSTKDLRILILLLTLFGKISAVGSTGKALVDIGVAQKVVSIMRIHADLDLREAGAFAASQLALTDFRAKEILISAIRPLISHFEVHGLSNRASDYIFTALSHILEEGYVSVPTFLEADGLRLVLRVFVHPAKYLETTVVAAMSCACASAKHWEYRRLLVENGLVAGVLMVLGQRNLQLVTLGCQTLCGLMGDGLGRKQFLEKEGYVRIALAMECPENAVPLAFVPLIHSICVHPELAVVLVEKGVLKEMWNRQDLAKHNPIFREALDRLLKSNLPAKYAITGHIEPYEVITDGFYDLGLLKKDEPFKPLHELAYEDRKPNQRILYLNLGSNPDAQVLSHNKILMVPIERNENVLTTYATTIQKLFLEQNESRRNERLLVGLIATVIADRMGGQVDKFSLSLQSEEMELSNFQNLHESTVIPITMIRNGVSGPRALLFKALADMFSIPCSLDRGGYNKCWNVVLLRLKDKHLPCACVSLEGNEQNIVFTEKLGRYVVDLLYQPGSLLPLHSYEAKTYCFN